MASAVLGVFMGQVREYLILERDVGLDKVRVRGGSLREIGVKELEGVVLEVKGVQGEL
jgi:hypothetical protein